MLRNTAHRTTADCSHPSSHPAAAWQVFPHATLLPAQPRCAAAHAHAVAAGEPHLLSSPPPSPAWRQCRKATPAGPLPDTRRAPQLRCSPELHPAKVGRGSGWPRSASAALHAQPDLSAGEAAQGCVLPLKPTLGSYHGSNMISCGAALAAHRENHFYCSLA